MQAVKTFFQHYFVPHKKNRYRAKALHLDALAVYLVLVVSLTLVLNQLQTTPGQILGYATDITIQKVYDLTNTERQKYGLEPLQYNEQLAAAAQNKAQDMFARDYWSHYGPDGTTPWDFILGSGYEYEYAGENLAKNFLFSDGVVKAWMASPTHKENIVRAEYTEVGYAVANGLLNGEETTLVVQMFGTPLESRIDSVYAGENTLPQAQQETVSQLQEQDTVMGKTEPVEVESGAPVVSQKTAVSSSSQTNQMFSFFGVAYNMKIVFLLLLFFVIAVDFYIGVRFHIIRVTGKNLVHLLFIGFIIAGVYFLAKGAII